MKQAEYMRNMHKDQSEQEEVENQIFTGLSGSDLFICVRMF